MYITKIASVQNFAVYIFFYLSFLSRILMIHGTAGEGRVPHLFLCTTSPAREQSDIYLQLCIGDDPIVLIASLVITRDAIR